MDKELADARGGIPEWFRTCPGSEWAMESLAVASSSGESAFAHALDFPEDLHYRGAVTSVRTAVPIRKGPGPRLKTNAEEAP